MKRKLTLFLIMLALVLACVSVILLGGKSTFDMLGFALLWVRMTAWALLVSFYYPLMAALGEDDLAEDYQRINDGNVAVAIDRAGEFIVVGATAAVLVTTI